MALSMVWLRRTQCAQHHALTKHVSKLTLAQDYFLKIKVSPPHLLVFLLLVERKRQLRIIVLLLVDFVMIFPLNALRKYESVGVANANYLTLVSA